MFRQTKSTLAQNTILAKLLSAKSESHKAVISRKFKDALIAGVSREFARHCWPI